MSVSAVVASPLRQSELQSRFFGYLRADAPLYIAILAYTGLGMLWMQVNGLGHLMTYSVYLLKWVTLFGFLFPVIAIALHLLKFVHRFDRRRALAARRVFATHNVARFAAGVCLLLAMMLFQGTFTSIKNSFPILEGGFPHDRLQADIDAALHFGVDPWRWLFTFAKHDWIRLVVEINYDVLWFVICFGALFFVVTSARTASIRTRYMACFMLVWIVVGNLLAGAFLSAGPAYYGHVTGDPTRFAEQLEFLAHGAGRGISAASYQAYLWDIYEAGIAGFGSGISAFPSVHVALITMNALFLYEHNKRLGTIAFGYVAFVLASSVYLAWHYAIDGYVAIAVTLAIYLALRRWLRPATARAVLPERS